VLFMPLEPVSYGSVTGGFSLTGSGTGTVTGSKGPEQVVRVKIVLGGALDTMTFAVAVGAGSAGYGSTVTSLSINGASPAYSYRVPGQRFTQLLFAAGTYVTGDVYTLNLDGTVTRVGTGTATLLNTSSNSPVDAYDVRVEIMAAGGLGVGSFHYSLDGGNNYSGTLTIPSSGTFVIPGTGIVLTFAGTFTLADLYTGASTAPGYTTTELAAGTTALLANPSEWGFLHVGGQAANAAASATLAAALGAVMDTAEAAFRYVRAIIECPQAEGDTAIKSAFASFVHPRIGVVAGDEGLISAVSLRNERRSVAWAYTAMLSATKLSTHPGETVSAHGAGPMLGATSLYRDEQATPGLDEARFVTARTIVGKPGYFITRGRMMASPGSDFSQIMNCRVMDRVCTIARSALLDFVNQSVHIDPVTHFILEADAQEIEAIVGSKLRAAIIDEDEASSVGIVVSRTDNLLSTSTLNVEIECVPKGYTENIKATIGFKNPALVAAAA
jgi:hypothetical protein